MSVLEYCENCISWCGDPFNPTYAKNDRGGLVKVGQCDNEEDDRAPSANLDGGYVFTRADATCLAFSPHPDIEADQTAIAETYRDLDRELLRDAWR